MPKFVSYLSVTAAILSMTSFIASQHTFADSPEQAGFTKANHLLETGNFASAQIAFTELSKEHPNNVVYVRQLADCYVHKSEFDKALPVLDRALSIAPDDFETNILRGNVLIVTHRPAQALSAFQKCVTLKPDSQQAHLGRGSANSELKKYDLALSDAAAAEKLGPDKLDIWLLRISCYEGLKQNDKALKACDRALRLAPKFGPLYLVRARHLHQAGQDEKALADLRTAEPYCRDKIADIYSMRGGIEQQLGRTKEAVKSLDKALSIEPNRVEALACRAFSHFELNEISQAKRDSQHALRNNPDFPLALTVLGICYVQEHHNTEAIAQLNHAIAVEPGFYFAYRWRADAERELNQLAAAIRDYSVVIKHDQKPDSDRLTRRARCYFAQQNFVAALADLDKAIAANPSDFGTRGVRARCLVELKRVDEGRQEIEQLTKNHPDADFLWRDRLSIERTLNNKTGIVQSLRALLRLNPNDSEWNKQLVSLNASQSADTSSAYKVKTGATSSNDLPFGANAFSVVHKTLEHSDAAEYLRQGEFKLKSLEGEKAIADFTEAIKIDPKLGDAYLQRALAYRSVDQYAKAFSDFDKALQIDPCNSDALLNSGRLHSFLKQPDAALRDYDKVIGLGNRNIAYLERAELLSSMNRQAEALADCQKALKLQQGIRELKMRGTVLSKMGRNKDAILDYSQAIKLAPRDSHLRRLRSTIYSKLGEKKLADQDLQLSKKLDSELDGIDLPQIK